MDHADHQNDPRVHVQKNETVKKQLALFDFDGTITTHDTLLEFIKFSKGKTAFYNGFVRNAPYLVGMKIKLLRNQQVKERILAHFFGGMPLDTFQQYCDDFAEKMIPGLLRPGAMEEIARLKKEGATIVIVSASPENWIRKWAEKEGLQLIATQLETKHNLLTGKITGNNCYGAEKVARIAALFNTQQFDHVLAYGDSSGDRPMLALAHSPHYKPFRS